jgi:outer membrane protein OmpA-like peptidoglycan-associated protein
MVSVVTNESEHRRGLVLGLTLAEVLLLLLFLILLALGDRLIKDEQALEAAERKVEAASAFFFGLKGGEFGKTDVQRLLDELAKIKPLEERVRKLADENTRISGELTAANTVEKIISAANSIDPNDSPAILKLGKDTLEAIGRSVDVQKIQILSELGSSLDKSSKADREKFSASMKVFISSGGQTPGHQWPPIIRLSDADGYSFQLGSAELTEEFERKIRQKTVLELLKMAKDYQVDVIEVVGHTDELGILPRPSNLDKELVPVLRGETEIKKLIPGDNAGLGLARAVAIVDVLKKDGRLKTFRVLPLSGAQLIQTDETLSSGTQTGDDPKRRRIEIRMRKSN